MITLYITCFHDRADHPVVPTRVTIASDHSLTGEQVQYVGKRMEL